MAGGNHFTIYALNKMLDAALGGYAITWPSTWTVRLYTTAMDTSGAGGVEVTGNNYSAATFSNSTSNFGAAASASKTTLQPVVFPVPTPAGWSPKSIAFHDEGGNAWFFYDLNGGAALVIPPNPFSVQVNAGGVTLSITA